eukprot:COSAG06_NODE_53266_length_301_cov_0.683168_1_plen_60_part_01
MIVCQDGLGTNARRKREIQKGDVFHDSRRLTEDVGKKTRFLRHFIVQMIIVPRQARDKHR